MLGILRVSGLSAVTLVDASLRHRIDDKESLETMIRSGQVTQTPAGRTADEFLVQLALRIREQRKSVYILTNDTFAENGGRGVCPRIAFLLVPLGDSEELLFSPTLESIKAPCPSDRSEGRRCLEG